VHVFLNRVFSAVSDVAVQIAHLCGAGSYDQPSLDERSRFFPKRFPMNDRRVTHVYYLSGEAGYG